VPSHNQLRNVTVTLEEAVAPWARIEAAAKIPVCHGDWENC
jgi:hypothetical protein